MADRAQVAAGILGLVREELQSRALAGRERPQPRPSGGAARATARMEARLLGPDRQPVGDLRVVVVVPNDLTDPATVNVRWARTAYGFWFVRTADLGPVASADEADLTELGMVLTAVGWTADGSVPLRSMIRTFPKVRRAAA